MLFSCLLAFYISKISQIQANTNMLKILNALQISSPPIEINKNSLKEILKYDKKYKSYCSSKYKKNPQENKDLKLTSLIVIHRHGDRAPLMMEASEWKNKDCMVCTMKDGTISNCKKNKCSEGDLSVKGYNQMVSLGEFIKDNYTEINTSKVSMRCTQVPRTQTSLHGVIKGLRNIDTLNNVKMPPADFDSLLVPKNCKFVNQRIETAYMDHFKPIISKDKFYNKINKLPPQRIADTYLTHLCNEIPLDCQFINCDKETVKSYIDESFKAWEDQCKYTLRNDEILEIVFGRFANDLKLIIESKEELSVISVHDSSLAIILAGLGTNITYHPPYASAIFIEIWKEKNIENESKNSDMTGSEDKDKYNGYFVRIIFNNDVCQTSIDSNPNIPLKKLVDYFDVLITSNDGMKDKCEAEDLGDLHRENKDKVKDAGLMMGGNGPKV